MAAKRRTPHIPAAQGMVEDNTLDLFIIDRR